MTVRPHSGLVAIGRWLEAEGKLPHPFRDRFKDEASMKANYDDIAQMALSKRKPMSPSSGPTRTRPRALSAPMAASSASAGTPRRRRCMKESFPVGYIAPKEGAMAWLQNFVVFKGAKNLDQVYEFLNDVNTPRAARPVRPAFGANSDGQGCGRQSPTRPRPSSRPPFPATR